MKKTILTTISIAIIAIPMYAHAYSKSVSFDLSSSIKGTTKFSLDSAKTTVTVDGNTYYASGKVSPDKSDYTPELYKSVFTNYSFRTQATGVTKTYSLGTISAGSYVLNFTKNTTNLYGERIKGSATVKQ